MYSSPPLLTPPSTPHQGFTLPPSRQIDEFLHRTIAAKGSDLHLSVGTTPWVSSHGLISPMEGQQRIFDKSDLAKMLEQMVTPAEWADYRLKNRLDFSYETDQARYRGHFAVAGGGPMAVFRVLANEVPDFEDLRLPAIVKEIVDYESGIVPFIGVTGSGKSSSLAALLKLIKQKHSKKIITIENPVEYKHTHGRSMIVQREVGVGRDVESFAIGIEDAMREAPDIIVIGEMRDPETMQGAIRAASSGHLVLTTLHAESTADTPTRILDSMSEGRVADVRAQLSRSLRAIVYQKLLPVRGGGGRALAAEVLMMNPAIANMIRQNNLEGIASQLMVRESGSIPFDVSLAKLVNDGVINESTAIRAELDPGSYMRQKNAGQR